MSVTQKRFPAVRLVAKTLAAILGFTVATYAVSASAAPNEHYTAFGWHTTKFTVRPFDETIHPAWNAALLSAAKTWNNSHPDVEISIEETSQNTVHFVNDFLAHDGRQAEYKKICLPTGCWFEISINSTHLALSPEEVPLLGEFLLLHELGHALGLNDFEPNSPSQSSVMAHYEKPHEKPQLRPYDKHLIVERIRLMDLNPHQLIPTLALGVLKPAAEWVAAAVVSDSRSQPDASITE